MVEVEDAKAALDKIWSKFWCSECEEVNQNSTEALGPRNIW